MVYSPTPESYPDYKFSKYTNKNLLRSSIVMFWIGVAASSCSAEAKQLSHHPNFEGSSPAPTTSIRREKKKTKVSAFSPCATTLSMTTFTITTLSIIVKNVTFSIMQNIVMLSVSYAECHTQALKAEWHYAECHSAECRGAFSLTCFSLSLLMRSSLYFLVLPKKFAFKIG